MFKKIRNYFNYLGKGLILIFIVCLANISVDNERMEIFSKAKNRVINLSLMALKIDEDKKNDLYAPLEVLNGDLTGYGADCPLCSGKLSCRPTYNVLDGTDTYVDGDYGKVRIVASSSNLPCGSIVRFQSKLDSEPIMAIVLDRGVGGNNLDLLTPSSEYARKYVGRSNITYEVLRKGWNRY